MPGLEINSSRMQSTYNVPGQNEVGKGVDASSMRQTDGMSQTSGTQPKTLSPLQEKLEDSFSFEENSDGWINVSLEKPSKTQNADPAGTIGGTSSAGGPNEVQGTKARIGERVVDLCDPKSMIEVSKGVVDNLIKDLDFLTKSAVEKCREKGRSTTAILCVSNCMARLRGKLDEARVALNLEECGSSPAEILSDRFDKLNAAKKMLREVRMIIRDCSKRMDDEFNPFSYLPGIREKGTKDMSPEELANARKTHDFYVTMRDVEEQLTVVGRIAVERTVREAQARAIAFYTDKNKCYYSDGKYSVKFSVELGVVAQLAEVANVKVGARYSFETNFSISRGGAVKVTSLHCLGPVAKGKAGVSDMVDIQGEIAMDWSLAGEGRLFSSVREAVNRAPLNVSVLLNGDKMQLLKKVLNIFKRGKYKNTVESAALKVDNLRFTKYLKDRNIIGKAARCSFYSFAREAASNEFNVSRNTQSVKLKGQVGSGINKLTGKNEVDGNLGTFEGNLKIKDETESYSKVTRLENSVFKTDGLLENNVKGIEFKNKYDAFFETLHKGEGFLKQIHAPGIKEDIKALAEKVRSAENIQDIKDACETLQEKLMGLRTELENFQHLMKIYSQAASEHYKMGTDVQEGSSYLAEYENSPEKAVQGLISKWGLEGKKKFGSDCEALVLKEILFCSAAYEKMSLAMEKMLAEQVPDDQDVPHCEELMKDIRDMVYNPQFSIGKDSLKNALFERKATGETKRNLGLHADVSVSVPILHDALQGVNGGPRLKGVKVLDNDDKARLDISLDINTPLPVNGDPQKGRSSLDEPERFTFRIGIGNGLLAAQAGSVFEMIGKSCDSIGKGVLTNVGTEALGMTPFSRLNFKDVLMNSLIPGDDYKKVRKQAEEFIEGQKNDIRQAVIQDINDGKIPSGNMEAEIERRIKEAKVPSLESKTNELMEQFEQESLKNIKPEENTFLNKLKSSFGFESDTANIWGLELSFVRVDGELRLESKSVVHEISRKYTLKADSTKFYPTVGGYMEGSGALYSKQRVWESVSSSAITAQILNYRNMEEVGNLEGWKTFMKQSPDAFLNFARAIAGRAKGGRHHDTIIADMKKIQQEIKAKDTSDDYANLNAYAKTVAQLIYTLDNYENMENKTVEARDAVLQCVTDVFDSILTATDQKRARFSSRELFEAKKNDELQNRLTEVRSDDVQSVKKREAAGFKHMQEVVGKELARLFSEGWNDKALKPEANALARKIQDIVTKIVTNEGYLKVVFDSLDDKSIRNVVDAAKCLVGTTVLRVLSSYSKEDVPELDNIASYIMGKQSSRLVKNAVYDRKGGKETDPASLEKQSSKTTRLPLPFNPVKEFGYEDNGSMLRDIRMGVGGERALVMLLQEMGRVTVKENASSESLKVKMGFKYRLTKYKDPFKKSWKNWKYNEEYFTPNNGNISQPVLHKYSYTGNMAELLQSSYEVITNPSKSVERVASHMGYVDSKTMATVLVIDSNFDKLDLQANNPALEKDSRKALREISSTLKSVILDDPAFINRLTQTQDADFGNDVIGACKTVVMNNVMRLLATYDKKVQADVLNALKKDPDYAPWFETEDPIKDLGFETNAAFLEKARKTSPNLTIQLLKKMNDILDLSDKNGFVRLITNRNYRLRYAQMNMVGEYYTKYIDPDHVVSNEEWAARVNSTKIKRQGTTVSESTLKNTSLDLSMEPYDPFKASSSVENLKNPVVPGDPGQGDDDIELEDDGTILLDDIFGKDDSKQAGMTQESPVDKARENERVFAKIDISKSMGALFKKTGNSLIYSFIAYSSITETKEDDKFKLESKDFSLSGIAEEKLDLAKSILSYLSLPEKVDEAKYGAVSKLLAKCLADVVDRLAEKFPHGGCQFEDLYEELVGDECPTALLAMSIEERTVALLDGLKMAMPFDYSLEAAAGQNKIYQGLERDVSCENHDLLTVFMQVQKMGTDPDSVAETRANIREALENRLAEKVGVEPSVIRSMNGYITNAEIKKLVQDYEKNNFNGKVDFALRKECSHLNEMLGRVASGSSLTMDELGFYAKEKGLKFSIRTIEVGENPDKPVCNEYGSGEPVVYMHCDGTMVTLLKKVGKNSVPPAAEQQEEVPKENENANLDVAQNIPKEPVILGFNQGIDREITVSGENLKLDTDVQLNHVSQQTTKSNSCFMWSVVNALRMTEKGRNFYANHIKGANISEDGSFSVYDSSSKTWKEQKYDDLVASVMERPFGEAFFKSVTESFNVKNRYEQAYLFYTFLTDDGYANSFVNFLDEGDEMLHPDKNLPVGLVGNTIKAFFGYSDEKVTSSIVAQIDGRLNPAEKTVSENLRNFSDSLSEGDKVGIVLYKGHYMAVDQIDLKNKTMICLDSNNPSGKTTLDFSNGDFGLVSFYAFPIPDEE